jgi:hypothetical protein
MTEGDRLLGELRATRGVLERGEDIDTAACADLIAAIHEIAPSLPAALVEQLRDELAGLEDEARDVMKLIDERLGELRKTQRGVHGYGSLRGHHKAQKLNRRA